MIMTRLLLTRLFSPVSKQSAACSTYCPFYMDQLFRDLNTTTGRHNEESVHLAIFPGHDESLIDKNLETGWILHRKFLQ